MSEVYSSVGDSSAAQLTQAWADRVAANREQAERLREESDGGDHYRPLASAFRADPHRTGDSAPGCVAGHRSTRRHLGRRRGWGRPVSRCRWRCTSSGSSRSNHRRRCVRSLRTLQIEHGITNVDLRDERWPTDEPSVDGMADVALISHVGYDIELMGAFLDTMERSATRECVALQYDRSPGSMFWQVWPAIHDEEQAELPGARELIELLRARGADVEARELERRGDRVRFVFEAPEDAMDWARRRLWLAQNSAKLPLLRNVVEELLVERDGGWSLPDQPKQMLIRWRTR